MSETLVRLATPDHPNRGRQWSDRDKQTAFEVWLSLGRPSRLSLAKILGDDYDLPIPERTLTYWYQTYHWDIDADKRIAQLAPNLNARSAAHIVSATSKAAAYVDRVWSGIEPYDKDKMTSALQTLDRGGFAAVSKDRPTTPAVDTRTSATKDLRTLTDAELLDLERTSQP